MRRGGWYGVAVLGLLLTAGGIATRVWSRTSAGQFDPVGAVIALTSLAVSLIAIRQAAQAQVKDDTDVQAMAARLAVVVGAAETKARQHLLGMHDRAIDVEFVFDRAPVHDAVGAKTKGNLQGVVDYYRRLSPRRVVITGAGGSGKTVLAVELILRLLEGRGPDEPVPVRLSAALLDTTRPGPSAVSDWLVDHLKRTFSLSETAARQLVEARMVLPVLDGLDEMDAANEPGYGSRAAQTIRACNAYLDSGRKAAMVITCRIGHYEALEAAREWVRDAARVTVSPVKVADACSFLTGRTGDEERWKPVLKALRPGGSKALGAALSTPWCLTLAAVVYDQRNPVTGTYLRDPADLVSSNLDTEARVRDHLLDLFIPAAAALHGGRYSSDRVRGWLVTLACYLKDNSSASGLPAQAGDEQAMPGTDLILHQLWPIVGMRRPRIVSLCIATLVGGVLVSLASANLYSASLRSQIAAFALMAFVFYVCVRIQWRVRLPAPIYVDFRRLRTRQGLAEAAARAKRDFLIALAAGALGGFVAEILKGPLAALEAALLTGVPAGLMLGISQGLPRAHYLSVGPRGPVRIANSLWFIASPVAALAVGLVEGLNSGAIAGVTSAGAVVLIGILFGPFFFSARQGRYFALLLCSRRWSSGWLPWRLGHFLDWCYAAGLLRIAGVGYQFRHREFLEYLAGRRVP